MPPPAALSIATPWRCPSCRHAIRPFSTSIPHQQTRPESPRYIDIPQPPQQSRPTYPRIRGFLPVPRDIFSRQEGGVEKVTADYLAAATKESARAQPIDPASPSAEYREWKQRMSARRRQNLREGLTELQTRRRRADGVVAARTLEKHRLRQEAIDAPERDDERLTKPTTTVLISAGRQQSGPLPDPNREQRLAAMRANVLEQKQRKSEERKQALHTLYMYARNFITNQEQLDEAIEKQFGTADKPATFGYRGTSLLATNLPETIKDKLKKAMGDRDGDDDVGKFTNVTDKRLRRIAEELTGGKM